MNKINRGNKTMNTKNHLPNPGNFKPGADKRRNDKGQVKGETVALGALLKQYLTDEGEKPSGKAKQTKAETLAEKIWSRALWGDFQFVQFLADRLMGKVKDELTLQNIPVDNELKIVVVHTDKDSNELPPQKQ